jgi:hypothetical protein
MMGIPDGTHRSPVPPEGIPLDVWTEARRIVDQRPLRTIDLAQAILAEREACARIADERAAICADAVAKIEAGDLYAGIATAAATESCASLEASHIARLIRRDLGAPPHRALTITANPTGA